MQHKTILLTLLLLLLSACGGAAVDPNIPPEIVYGEDVCDQCGMIISDDRFAAALTLEKAANDYEQLLFDDAGEMFAYVAEDNGQSKIASWFVHDYNSREWLAGEVAWYVLADSLRTPMGFGIAALAQEAEARALAMEWGGEVLTFAQVMEKVGGMESMNSRGHK
ncbi:MAG: nitrous oxide reductase accessory protein NosL [Caldilineaceae bacterium]|nr:nitrous oxide reductase accessory protein NosL [Caldilineaceae bacterium]